MQTELKDKTRSFFQWINNKEYNPAFDLFHEDLQWIIMGTANVSGKYDKRKISLGLKGLARSFENFVFTIHEMTAEEDRVSVIAESHGLRKANGKKYNNHYHFLFRFVDGKIIEVKEFFDTIHANWVEENP
ncbi:nuclear transport factor 2 family protein [Leptospira sp. GIMC2001]|uniref:nuclear transport factor 2 family protein n=1 Tax=Leptospira sp. GIMC2001 TaxID=1513297 RepID=UPI00234A9722|nr:nuclear transport factor 2 family protein [Leptospira sp. GIMC2001]WCL50562.1 nuclear transport factor 2 family protein [Leptospira sp. GIMC2001]